MNFHWTSSKTRWKDSITLSLALLTTIQAIAEITGFFDIDYVKGVVWWVKLIWIVFIFMVLTIIVFVIKYRIALKGIKVNIGDNEVRIKQADLFEQNGLRLIPFNEYFDTQVDDVVIAHNTLNGIFIDKYVDSLERLQNVINNAPDVKGGNCRSANGKNKFPLGRIIKYDDYLLLAFTHFDECNRAYLSHTDFEKCLIKMWQEINRVYANKPVFIPLLGSGITRFTDTPHKDNLSLANCLLCTLKMSGIHLKQPITICLTEDVINDLNIYELKSK